MANKFWVGGGTNTNWNSSPTTNWANSSGGPGNQTAPGSSDLVVFDSNSGTANSVISANITVQGLECDGSTAGTGAYGGTITHNTAVTLTINTGAANSLRFASGMTYTPASTTAKIAFTHTTGTANIKSYGKALAALQINGAGGTTQTLDDLKVNAVATSPFTLTAGIFDFNGGAGGPFAFTANTIDLSANNTRSFIMGGTCKIGGNVATNSTIWFIANAGTLTFTKNSSNIEVLAPSSAIATVVFATTNITYNDLILDASTMQTNFCLAATGGSTFAHLTANTGWNLIFTQSGTVTISNPFTWAGTQALPMNVMFTYNITPPTISCASGACSLNWGSITGINAGGGATFTATNTMNGGNTAGWSISPPADATAVLSAAEVTTLGRIIDGVALGTVTTGASTTSIPTSALAFNGVAATGVVSNQFVGRNVQFDRGTTTAGLRGILSAISASTASNTPTFTVATLPATPVSGDTFVVI